MSIVGYGDLTVSFCTDHGWIRVEMNDVAHVPQLSYNLISLLSMTQKGHTYTCDIDGVTLKLKGGETVFFPLVGKLCRQYGYRPEAAGSMVDTACATIAPGKAKAPTTPTDINILHCTFGHTHEVRLKKTATQQGIAYNGELHECRGCSMAKGLRKPIARLTHTRADKKLQRVFVDLSGPMAVQSIGGKQYTLIVRDDCTRFTRVNCFRHKSDAASAFESFLAEVRADGTPSAVMAVRSANGREFFGGAFGELCRKRGIKQEFTPADSPKYNGVAERALGLINDAAVAARIQTTELYPNAPNYTSLWAEAASWACHALNCTATTANPGDKSLYEMWYGSPPPRGAVWPFLKPTVCRVKRANNSLPKAQDCYYVGPGVNHPRDCMRVLTANRSILTTRNVTWRHVPLPPPTPPQQLPPIAEEGGSTAGGGASGEGAPSQGRGRVEEDLDGESDLDVTEVGPMLTAMRETETAETGAGGGGVAEGDPAASSDSHGSNSTSSRISSSTSGRNSSSSSNNISTNRGDVPTLAGREAHRQRWDGKIPALQGGRTRSQSRQHQMSAGIADALLTHARRTEEEDTATERVHDLLLEGRLEEEHEGRGKMMEWLEEDGPALERREEAQDPDCPLAMAAEQDPEISTPAPIGKQPSEVESPPLSVAGIERSVYPKGWEEAMKLEFDGRIKTGPFPMVDRVPEGRKPLSSKWCFTYKTDKEGKITNLKARLVARGFTQICDVDYTHSSSPGPSSASVKLILTVANEKGLPLRHFDVAQAYIRASLDEEVYMKLPGGCGEKSRETTKLERAIYGLK